MTGWFRVSTGVEVLIDWELFARAPQLREVYREDLEAILWLVELRVERGVTEHLYGGVAARGAVNNVSGACKARLAIWGARTCQVIPI